MKEEGAAMVGVRAGEEERISLCRFSNWTLRKCFRHKSVLGWNIGLQF
jgi:hypothetical protein